MRWPTHAPPLRIPVTLQILQWIDPEDLALDVPTEAAPGADEVGAAALSVAVEDDLGAVELPDDDYTGDWREDFGDSVGISSWREL